MRTSAMAEFVGSAIDGRSMSVALDADGQPCPQVSIIRISHPSLPKDALLSFTGDLSQDDLPPGLVVTAEVILFDKPEVLASGRLRYFAVPKTEGVT